MITAASSSSILHEAHRSAVAGGRSVAARTPRTRRSQLREHDVVGLVTAARRGFVDFAVGVGGVNSDPGPGPDDPCCCSCCCRGVGEACRTRALSSLGKRQVHARTARRAVVTRRHMSACNNDTPDCDDDNTATTTTTTRQQQQRQQQPTRQQRHQKYHSQPTCSCWPWHRRRRTRRRVWWRCAAPCCASPSTAPTRPPAT